MAGDGANSIAAADKLHGLVPFVEDALDVFAERDGMTVVIMDWTLLVH